jgi:hypothetical protein
LHIDDIEVLDKIVQTLGIGRVIKSKSRNSARLSVYKFDDIVRVLIPIFQEFPLQTSKFLDFISFLEVALIKLDISPSSSGSLCITEIKDGRRKLQLSKSDLIKIKKLKETMNSGRLTINKEQENFLINKISVHQG